MNMRFYKKFFAMCLSLVALVPLSLFAEENFEKMFETRAKCMVSVKYIMQLEEDRRQYEVTGLVVDDKGLVMLSVGDVDPDVGISELKDFKVFVFGGDEDGYEAEYLGASKYYGANFVRLKKLPVEGLMLPYSNFKIADFEIGEKVWGVQSMGESFSYAKSMSTSTICFKDKIPLSSGICGEGITNRAGPVFNFKGEFLGMGTSTRSIDSDLYLYTPDRKRFPASIAHRNAPDIFLAASEIGEILNFIPKNPEGDSSGWLGTFGTQALKKDVAKLMGLSDKGALVVGDVIEGSAADIAGLKKGDILVGMNDRPFERFNLENAFRTKFSMDISKTSPGDKIVLDVISSGQEKPRKLELVLGEIPNTFRKAKKLYFPRLGFSIREFLVFDAVDRRILKMDEQGAVIKYVKPNSPAHSAQPTAVKRRDRIKEINSIKVENYAHALEILSKIEADESQKEIVLMLEDLNETKVVRINLK